METDRDRETADPPGRDARLRRHELSIVACDLRGFTAFAEAARADDTVELLREYYVAVGEVVSAFRGQVKEHAGDGTLVLVGAGGASTDHAERAVAIGHAVVARARRIVWRRRHVGLPLGLGVGVASGEVTFGTIATAARPQAIAVGPAVNLAARLCAKAKDGQILVDERTIRLVGGGRRRFEPLEVARLKGFSRPVSIFRAVGG